MEHKTKYKQLTEAYLHALGVITESTATWAEFLCSAAYTYEERFQSQVLLHHQRPGVKAVATLNQWDREKNRHIIRGSHGIPVFDAKHPECLTYVFDYQDTAGRSTPGLFPWTVSLTKKEEKQTCIPKYKNFKLKLIKLMPLWLPIRRSIWNT